MYEEIDHDEWFEAWVELGGNKNDNGAVKLGVCNVSDRAGRVSPVREGLVFGGNGGHVLSDIRYRKNFSSVVANPYVPRRRNTGKRRG